MERVEEILEVARIVNEAANRLVAVLERSGADKLRAPQMLREIARFQPDIAAIETRMPDLRQPNDRRIG
jgi:hypothetical protein